MADSRRVIAVTVIQRATKPGVRGDKSKGIAPIRPEMQTIKPGTIFNASTVVKQGMSRSEYDELLAAGAIREPEKGEKVSVPIESLEAEDTGKKAAVASTGSGKGKGKGKASTKADNGGSGGDGSDLV
jgi:hypothetical protein